MIIESLLLIVLFLVEFLICKMRTAKFPCSVCKKNCISTSSALFCGSCERWHHAKCENISASSYEKWGCLNGMDYICTGCRTIDGSSFDYLMGLERPRRVRLG